MRRLILTLAIVLALSSTTACGIEAARDAGERAAGDARKEDTPKPADSPDAAGSKTPAPEKTSAQPAAGGGEKTSAEERAQVSGEGNTGEPVLDEKWYQDSDGNYVPDFIEVANGNDPSKDDCAPEQCPGAAQGAEFLSEKRNALLILDSSGSMAADDGSGASRTKMEAAKEALARYSGVSATLYETGFAVFGHEGDTTRAGRTVSCREAAELLSPLGEVDPATFEGTLARFQPTGWTPIEGALREAEAAFAGKEGEVNRIILVSDGIETCGGDPVAAAEELHRSGIELTVDVVGFGVPDDDAEQLRDIATAGGGEYFDARTGADLDAYFRRQGEALGETFDAATCELNNGFHDTLCDNELCQNATVFRIPEEQQKYEYGSPEYQALQDISDRINAGLEEREKAREEAMARSEELMDQYVRLQEQFTWAFRAAYGV